MATILLDVDGVIADCASAVKAFTEDQIGRKVPPIHEWSHYDFEPAMKLSRNEIEVFQDRIKYSDLGWRIKFLPEAQSFVEHLAMVGHTVVFVTAHWRGVEHWVEAREALLAPFLGRRKFHLVFTHDKWLVQGDWLIDDKWGNLKHTPERGILFAQPWNAAHRELAHHVVKDYREVLEVIK